MSVHFNVSHSDGTALVAIASAEIGVDIERIDGSVDYAGVAQSVFSRSEIEMLARCFRCSARRGIFLDLDAKRGIPQSDGRRLLVQSSHDFHGLTGRHD